MNHRLALLLIFISILTSCGRHGNDVLNRADDIMEDDPEQALELLTSVDATALSRSDAAYRAMLLTQAQVKCSADIPSDSLINSAIEYYRSARDDDRRLRAYFYKGQLSFCYHDYRESMKYILEAYEMAKELCAPLWIARSAEVLSDINFDVYNYPQAELYSRETIDNYRLAGKSNNVDYALCDFAVILFNQDKHHEALAILDSIYLSTLNKTPVDSALLNYIKDPLTGTLINCRQIDKLKNYGLYEPVDNYENYLKQGFLSLYEDNFAKADSAISCASRMAITNDEQIRSMFLRFRYALMTEDYSLGAKLADSLFIMQSQIVNEVLYESVTGVQKDFYSERSNSYERKSEILFKSLIVAVVAGIVILSLSIWIFSLKIKQRKEKLESVMSSLMEMKSHADRISNDNIRLSEILKKESDSRHFSELKNAEIIESLFKQKWTTLNMLCNEYFELSDSKKIQNHILRKVENEFKTICSKKSLMQIEDAVDRYMNGIMKLLRDECKFLKEDDFIFISLIFAGLSVRAVCMFTGIKYKYFYLKKSRIRERISESDAIHKDLFLAKIK
ncbi:MAG: hypothetical protein K2H48_06660 [Duncaniella sp.]|nr:hypothetical protein [Duncaniella sp.]